MMSYRLGFAADRPRAHVSSKRNWKVALSRVFDYRMQNHVPGATKHAGALVNQKQCDATGPMI